MGSDDVGNFRIRGRYDPSAGECYWTKSYIRAHEVFYRGFREGKGIWGTWEITVRDHGGFHIWPRRTGETQELAASAKQDEVAEAVGSEMASQS